MLSPPLLEQIYCLRLPRLFHSKNQYLLHPPENTLKKKNELSIQIIQQCNTYSLEEEEKNVLQKELKMFIILQ